MASKLQDNLDKMDKKNKLTNECCNIPREKKNVEDENIEEKKAIVKECSDCDVINNSIGGYDKRQDLYLQIIGEELKLVQPCMRTRTFIRIMNFLDSAKKCHSNDVQLTESEKNNWNT